MAWTTEHTRLVSVGVFSGLVGLGRSGLIVGVGEFVVELDLLGNPHVLFHDWSARRLVY